MSSLLEYFLPTSESRLEFLKYYHFFVLRRIENIYLREMERTGTGIGSLHFVYCLTEQVKINLPLRILHCNYRNITDSLLASGK